MRIRTRDRVFWQGHLSEDSTVWGKAPFIPWPPAEAPYKTSPDTRQLQASPRPSNLSASSPYRNQRRNIIIEAVQSTLSSFSPLSIIILSSETKYQLIIGLALSSRAIVILELRRNTWGAGEVNILLSFCVHMKKNEGSLNPACRSSGEHPIISAKIKPFGEGPFINGNY